MLRIEKGPRSHGRPLKFGPGRIHPRRIVQYSTANDRRRNAHFVSGKINVFASAPISPSWETSGQAISRQAAQQRRGAADRGEYRQAAGVGAQSVIRSVELTRQGCVLQRNPAPLLRGPVAGILDFDGLARQIEIGARLTAMHHALHEILDFLQIATRPFLFEA